MELARFLPIAPPKLQRQAPGQHGVQMELASRLMLLLKLQVAFRGQGGRTHLASLLSLLPLSNQLNGPMCHLRQRLAQPVSLAPTGMLGVILRLRADWLPSIPVVLPATLLPVVGLLLPLPLPLC